MSRVLIVDDNPDFRLLFRLAVEGQGLLEVVGEAEDAETAIAKAGSLAPDVILLDILMPGMDGLTAIPLLREAAPGASIVAVSAYPEHHLWRHSPSAATVPYMSKSIPVDQLGPELIRLAGIAHHGETPLASDSTKLPADLQSARAARRFVRSTLEEWGCDDVLDSVELLVSELVTNAVIHARSEVELVLTHAQGCVRVEVIDSTDVYIQRRDAAEDDQSGRGMALIESLASAWGIETLVAGKAVWFEVARQLEPHAQST